MFNKFQGLAIGVLLLPSCLIPMVIQTLNNYLQQSNLPVRELCDCFRYFFNVHSPLLKHVDQYPTPLEEKNNYNFKS